METFRIAVEIVGGVSLLIGALFAIGKIVISFAEGQKCLLRAEMLRIYYKYQSTQQVPQYELENFWKSYNAYRNLKGNSFIEDVADEVHGWTIKPKGV